MNSLTAGSDTLPAQPWWSRAAPLFSLMAAWGAMKLSGWAYPLRSVTTANPFIRVVLLCGLSIATATLALWLLDREGNQALRAPRRLRVALAALCLAPLAVLINARSPVVLGAGFLLAMALIWLTLAERDWSSSAAPGDTDRQLFDFHFARTLRQSPLPALALAIGAHLVPVLLLTGRLRVAVSLLVASLVGAAWWLSVLRDTPPSMPRMWRKNLVAVTALLMAFIGLLPPGRGSGMMGFDPVRARASSSPPPKEASGSASSHSGESVGEGGTHDGVIMLPEEELHTLLVPPLPSLRPNPFDSRQQEPLSIPFFGVYWLFKFPDRRPPPGSMVKRGTPETLKFRSTDWRPLILEGRQNLGKSFDVSCCSRIELDISNADMYPNSVQVGLTLIDTRSPAQPAWKLPRANVTTFQTPGDGAAVPETLRFPFTTDGAAPPLTQFDEMHIRFHLIGGREKASPRMAIRRFRLVPRAR